MVKKDNFKTDKLEKVRDAVNVCTMCGFCKSVCPSFKAIGWDSALARGRVILSYGLLNGDIPADDSVIENIYTCDMHGLRTQMSVKGKDRRHRRTVPFRSCEERSYPFKA